MKEIRIQIGTAKSRERRKFGIAMCERCEKEYFKSSPSQKYCGSNIRQEGCSHIVYKENLKQWRKRNPKYPKLWARSNPGKISLYVERRKELYFTLANYHCLDCGGNNIERKSIRILRRTFNNLPT